MCFGKSISSHTHAFLFLIFNALRCVYKNQVIFLERYFSRFSINPICFSINRNLKKKKFGEPLFGSIDRNCFSINRTSWIRFFKTWILTFSKELFQKYFKFSLSLRFRLGSTLDFCRFLSFLLQGFFLQTLVRPFYPSFCFYFHISCSLIWEFQTMHKFGFLMIQAKFCVIDHWVLLQYCYIHDLCRKIWSIWRFVKNQNF